MTSFDNINDSSAQTSEPFFEELFNLHWSQIHTFLTGFTGDVHEAEDLALEVFWKLHRKLSNSTGRAPTKAWLYRVATNQALNALRARKRRNRYEDEALQQAILLEQEQDPAELLERIQARQKVRTVLASMRPRAARILMMRSVGLCYREIAAAIHVSPASVGSLLTRAAREFERRYKSLEGVK